MLAASCGLKAMLLVEEVAAAPRTARGGGTARHAAGRERDQRGGAVRRPIHRSARLSPAQIPAGNTTALIGVPYFLLLSCFGSGVSSKTVDP